MPAEFLRVKNWSSKQHYSDRRPPWIKLYQGLLGDDQDFERLDELTQYQLIRIWLVASRSPSLTLDEDGKRVPVVPNDAASLQRSIMSLRKVPLAQLVRDGWLIPVDAGALLPPEETPKPKRRRSRPDAASADAASTGASTNASGGASVALRGREGEVQSLGTEPGRSSTRAPAEDDCLPIKNELNVARLLNRIGDHADQGTRHVVRAYADRLPEAAVAKVVESLEQQQPANRAAYAVAALRSELDERRIA